MNPGSPPLTREAEGGGHRKAASFQSMFLQPTIHGAASQSLSLGCLADVSFVEAHLLQLSHATSGLRPQAEVCRANGRAGGQEHAAFHRMIQFADVARPGMLMKSLDSGGVE